MSDTGLIVADKAICMLIPLSLHIIIAMSTHGICYAYNTIRDKRVGWKVFDPNMERTMIQEGSGRDVQLCT
jgi:hypothetical protein